MQRKKNLKYWLDRAIYLNMQCDKEVKEAFEEYEEKLRINERMLKREMDENEM